METVFVSSTCYDLIDLRAEVEKELVRLGLVPIMSDRPSSEFEVAPDASSVESCLVNVRKADAVIIVLSQRYGPTLASAGFGDVSATHLEYREARKCAKPLFFYVRDRLEADYAIWKRNPGGAVKLSWVKPGDEGIFALLEEHRKLAADTDKSNWFWLFRDSVELRGLIARDLQASSGEAILRALIEKGDVALLVSTVEERWADPRTSTLGLTLSVKNVGTAAAIEPDATLSTADDHYEGALKTLLPGASDSCDFEVILTPEQFRTGKLTLGLESSYTTPHGHYISDESLVEIAWAPADGRVDRVACSYTGKKYYYSDAFEIGFGEDDEDDGSPPVPGSGAGS